MGNFYTNVTTREPSQSDLATFLRELGRRAFVTPATNSFTATFDEECETQDTDVLASLALTLSTHFRCPAGSPQSRRRCALVSTSQPRPADRRVHLRRQLVGHQRRSSAKGHPEILCGAMGAPGDPARVRRILNRATGVLGYVFAHCRYDDLLQALGHPSFAVGLGYNYLKKGDLPEGPTSEQLLLV